MRAIVSSFEVSIIEAYPLDCLTLYYQDTRWETLPSYTCEIKKTMVPKIVL